MTNPYHHGDLRRALIEATLDLIEESPNISLRQAARRVGVSPRAPYRHFKNREELLMAVVEEAVKLHQGLVEEVLAEQPQTGPLAAFQCHALAGARFASQRPGLYRLMNAPETLAARGPRWREITRQQQEALLALIKAGQDAGELAAVPPQTILLTAQAVTYGLLRLIIDGQLEFSDVETKGKEEQLMLAVTEMIGIGFQPR